MADPSSPIARAPEGRSSVRRTVDGGSTVLAVEGALDTHVGSVLVAAVHDAVVHGVDRLEVDLAAVDAFDDAGLASLLACRDAAREISGGLHYRTCGGPGQAALLAAFADEESA